jgi:hypothetical protein
VSIRYEKSFEEELAELGNFYRIDEALRYIEQRLDESPESGIPTPIPGLWVVPVRLPTDSGLTLVSIFYTYDGTDVAFQELKRAP